MANKLELTWYGKEKEINVEPRILIEDKSLSYSKNEITSLIGNIKQTFDNLLIHGDNLLALKALEQDFTGKIKCIYIDPPYNTGSAFEHYDDNLEHSTWLSLMKPRLELLQKLLSEDGSIWIQIDDNEQAYLKVLCDEIFGRRNFISTICVKMSTLSGVKIAHKEKTIVKEKEFILVYAKDIEHFRINPQYVPINFIDDEFQYFLEKNNSQNPENWEVKHLSDVLSSLSLKKDLNDKKFINFINEYQNNIWRRAFIRNEYKKLSQENPNKIFYINKDGKEHYYYRGREMFFLRDKFHKCLTEDGYINALSNLLGDIWLDINTGKLFNEGGIEFRNSKKPEFLISRIIDMCTRPGDYVLDSFLGSGTTAAVAHKMNRRWIGIELGEHAYSLAKVRIDNVINGEQGGISRGFNWQGGGGYKFYELAPTLIKTDTFGEEIINPEYNGEMLSAAVAKHEGYFYNPDKDYYWKQAKSENNSYLYVTTRHVNKDMVEAIKQEMKDDEFLLIVCKSFDSYCIADYQKSIAIKKIPQSLLKNCEFGVDNYNLNIVCPPEYEEEDDDE